MKVYTIQETEYECLEETLECIVDKAKKLLYKMSSGEFGNKKYSKKSYDEDYEDEDDYDWKIKNRRYSRY